MNIYFFFFFSYFNGIQHFDFNCYRVRPVFWHRLCSEGPYYREASLVRYYGPLDCCHHCGSTFALCPASFHYQMGQSHGTLLCRRLGLTHAAAKRHEGSSHLLHICVSSSLLHSHCGHVSGLYHDHLEIVVGTNPRWTTGKRYKEPDTRQAKGMYNLWIADWMWNWVIIWRVLD